MKKALVVLKIAFIAGLIIWAALTFNAGQAKAVLASANLWFVVLAVAAYFAATLFYTLRWQVIIRGFWKDARLSTGTLYRFLLLAGFYTLFIPTSIAGEAVRLWKLSKETGNDYAKSTITVALDRMLGAVLWFLIFLVSPSPFHNNVFWLLLILIVPAVYLLQKKMVFLNDKIIDFSRHHPKDIVLGIFASLAGQILYIFANYLVFRCFGIPITLYQTAGIASLAVLAGIIPVTWLGITLREGIYIGLLPGYGASSSQALLVITVLVALNYLVGLTGGIIELALTGWNVSKMKLPKETSTSDTTQTSQDTVKQ